MWDKITKVSFIIWVVFLVIAVFTIEQVFNALAEHFPFNYNSVPLANLAKALDIPSKVIDALSFVSAIVGAIFSRRGRRLTFPPSSF